MQEAKPVFTCQFMGHYLTGYAVVCADNAGDAAALLNAELITHGLTGNEVEAKDMIPLRTDGWAVRVLSNGDY